MTTDKLIQHQPKQSALLISVGVAFILTFILCFIDEGYYDLRWMKSGYNWFCFALYFLGFALGMAMVSELISYKWGRQKILPTLLLGLPLGVLLIFCFMYGIAIIQGIISFFMYV